jgi:hypothetical protein
MRWLLALSVLAAISPARADRKMVVKSTFNGHSVVNTTYSQGLNQRWESDASPLIQVLNANGRSILLLDVAAKQYAVPHRESDPVLALATWLRRPPHVIQSGKTVHTYFEAIDTGQNRRMFGQTAHRWITRERIEAEPGACIGSTTIENDGWYLPGPEPGKVAYLGLSGGTRCQDTNIAHGAKKELGLALLEQTHIHGPRFSQTNTREVIEFSDQPLDPALFEPPKNFTRVEALSGNHRVSRLQKLEQSWQQLEQSIASWL